MAILPPVNTAQGADNAGTSSLVVTIPSTTAGNLLIACVGTKDAADFVTAITGGGTWVQARDTGGGEGASQQTEIWYCENCSGSVTSLTFDLNGNTRIVAWIGEFPGAATTSVEDTGASASSGAVGTSDTPAPGSYTPSQAAGLAIMCTQFANTSTTVSARPTGFTPPANGNVESAAASASGVELDVVYKIDPGTSAIAESWTISSSRAWGAVSSVFKQAGGGAGAALAGASDGTSTGAATALKLNHAVAGSTAGTSTADALRLILNHALSGTVAGTSTADATSIAVTHPLSGTTDGVSTADASALTLTQPLSGDSAGTSTAAAPGLVLDHALVGASDGTSTGIATTLTLEHVLDGSSAGVSTAAVTTLTLDHELAASSTGVSSADATSLALDHALTATADGTSTADAPGLALEHALAGLSTGVSTATADLSLAGAGAALSGASDGISTAEATALTLDHALAGTSTGIAAVAATTLTLDHALAGTADGTSTAAADLTVSATGAVLAGASDGVSTATAAGIIVAHILAGTASGTSTAAVSALSLSHALNGSSSGTSTAAATAFILDGSLPVPDVRTLTVPLALRSIAVLYEPRGVSVSSEVRHMSIATDDPRLIAVLNAPRIVYTTRDALRMPIVPLALRGVQARAHDADGGSPVTFYKDPDAVLDYTVDWSDWLDGDTISTSMWIVPAGITEVSDSNTTTATAVFLSSGVVGMIYEVTNRITTAGGRTNDWSFRLGIRNQ